MIRDWSTEALGVADGHHWLADLGPSVPGANAPVSIAFVLKRFAAKAPCVKIKGDFILLLELLIGHRGADGCEPRHLALLLLANSDYLIPTEKGLLSILQLLARNPEKRRPSKTLAHLRDGAPGGRGDARARQGLLREA